MSIFDIFNQLDQKKQTAGKIEYIICGLGNPGTKYENTRHNAGFMAVDKIGESCGEKITRLKFKSLTGVVNLEGTSCLLMKPSTFMNKSGEAVVDALNFYKLDTEKLIVISDDVSLDVGKMRIKRKGSDGGHNGLKNIIYLTGKDNFCRIKIGVGKKPHPDFDLADWVLSPFKKEEGEALEQCLKNAQESASLIMSGKTDEAMNKFN